VTVLVAKVKKAKESRVGLGDVVTFIGSKPFVKYISAWGTIVEVVDRGVSGQHVLCGIQWFNVPAGKRGHISYHYESELVRLDEKMAYDSLGRSVVNRD
jgi:hypothetical protein